jgi:excisionase family DNA binding protein
VSRRSTTASSIAAAAAIESLPDAYAVAKKCGVTVRTVQRWVKTKFLPSVKFGPRCTRFRWGDVEQVIERLAKGEDR